MIKLFQDELPINVNLPFFAQKNIYLLKAKTTVGLFQMILYYLSLFTKKIYLKDWYLLQEL